MDAIADLLRELEVCAALPLARARALPGALYADEEIYALEVERIFRREWMCVAREEELAEPGDWIAIDLVGEPILVVRDGDQGLLALSRVCPHRSQDVCNERTADRGNDGRLVCPYHLWSFRLDGSCIGAPDMAGSEVFDRDACGLAHLAIATWHGFVFVNLDPDAAPLASRMAGVEAVIGCVDLSTWTLARTLDWGELPVSWKVVVENAIECYHHVGTHRDTLEPIYPHGTVEVTLSDSSEWIAGHMVTAPAFSTGKGEDGHPLHPLFFDRPAAGLTPALRASNLIVGVFPMFFFALAPDFLTWFRWFPTGPGHHRVQLGIVVPPEAMAQANREEVLDAIEEAVRAIQAEDTATNAGVTRSLHSRFAGGGPLSPLEHPIWRFQQYLASRLVG